MPPSFRLKKICKSFLLSPTGRGDSSPLIYWMRQSWVTRIIGLPRHSVVSPSLFSDLLSWRHLPCKARSETDPVLARCVARTCVVSNIPGRINRPYLDIGWAAAKAAGDSSANISGCVSKQSTQSFGKKRIYWGMKIQYIILNLSSCLIQSPLRHISMSSTQLGELLVTKQLLNILASCD